MKMKYTYCMVIVILALTVSKSFAQNVMESKHIKYPYYASKERTDQIKNNYKKVQKDMSQNKLNLCWGNQTKPHYYMSLKYGMQNKLDIRAGLSFNENVKTDQ